MEEAGTNSATVTLTVTITDVDDNTPSCTVTDFSTSASETVTTPHTVSTLGCTDADSSSTVSYALTSGDASVFSVTSGGLVQITSGLDYDLGTRHYDLVVTVSDDAVPPHTVDIAGSVTVNPVNEHTPTWDPAVAAGNRA